MLQDEHECIIFEMFKPDTFLQPATKLKHFCDELKGASLHSAPLQLTLLCALESKKSGTYLYLLVFVLLLQVILLCDRVH